MPNKPQPIRIIDSELPHHWRRATIDKLLGDALELVQDGNHGGAYPKPEEFAEGGIPLITGADLHDGVIDLENCKFLKPESASRLRIGFAKTGDVLLTHKGTMGKTAIVPPLQWPYIILNPQLTLYRVSRRGSINNRYLKFFFDSTPFQAFLLRISGTSTISTLSLTIQKSLEIPLPPIEEQLSIAAVLGSLDDKIEQNRWTGRKLEELARGVFQAWFVDFEPVKAKAAGATAFPGMPPAAFAALPERLTPSLLGPVPEGWEMGTMGSIGEQRREQVAPHELDGETPYIGLEHMPRRDIMLSDWGAAASVTSSKFRFRRGDILFGKLRPYFHKVGPAPLNGVCSTDIVVLHPKRPEYAAWLLMLVSSDNFVAHTDRSSAGTKMPRTNWKDMAAFEATAPPSKLAAAYQDQVGSMLELITASIHESRRLAALRDYLLPRLLSGQVRVKEAEHVAEAVA